MNATQYTSFYKSQRRLSTFPIRAHFDDVRYKKKKPIPSNNTYVAVEGSLFHVDMDTNTGGPLLFHIMVDNINFLGRATLPAANVGETQGPSCSLLSVFLWHNCSCYRFDVYALIFEVRVQLRRNAYHLPTISCAKDCEPVDPNSCRGFVEKTREKGTSLN